MLSVDYKIITVLFLTSSILAQDKFEARQHFLSYGPGVAATSMGEARVAANDDMSSVYYNPALLFNLYERQFSAAHWILYDGAKYNFLGFCDSDEDSALAFSAAQLLRRNIEIRTAIGDKPISAKAAQTVVFTSYAKHIRSLKLNIGITAKYLNQDLWKINKKGAGWDLGLSKCVFEAGNPNGRNIKFDWGAVARNAHTAAPNYLNCEFYNETDEYPIEYQTGAALTFQFAPKYYKEKAVLGVNEICFEVDKYFSDGYSKLIGGISYDYYKKIILRGGWNAGPTAGVGIYLSGFRMDYSYQIKDFVSFQKIGFVYAFDKVKDVQAKYTPTVVVEFEEVYTKAKRMYAQLCRGAEEDLKKHNPEAALEKLYRAEALLPEQNRKSKDLIIMADNAIVTKHITAVLDTGRGFEQKGNFAAAYNEYVNAFDISPADANNQAMMKYIYQVVTVINPELITARKKIQGIEKKYIKRKAALIEMDIEKGLYDFAEKEVGKMSYFLTDKKIAEKWKKKIAAAKQKETNKILMSGLDAVKEKQYVKAYKQFKAVQKYIPNDKMIKEQVSVLKKKIDKKNRKKLANKMHSEKLYYLAGIDFANNEKSMRNLNELRSFDPTYKYIDVLNEAYKSRRKKGRTK